MLSHCQHGGGLTADFGPDVVYCHDCSREWYYGDHDEPCPGCQDEAVENASCDSDAHGFDQIPPTRSSDTHISHDEAPGGFGIGGDQETLAAAGQPRVGQAREAIIGGDAPLLWVTNDSLIIAADNVSLLQSMFSRDNLPTRRPDNNASMAVRNSEYAMELSRTVHELNGLITRLFQSESSTTAHPPASQKALQALSRRIVKQTGEKASECPVCLDDTKVGDMVVALLCKHLFHYDCIYPWLKECCTCPVCRTPLEDGEDEGYKSAPVKDSPAIGNMP